MTETEALILLNQAHILNAMALIVKVKELEVILIKCSEDTSAYVNKQYQHDKFN